MNSKYDYMPAYWIYHKGY